jgi:hypothetical protein
MFLCFLLQQSKQTTNLMNLVVCCAIIKSQSFYFSQLALRNARLIDKPGKTFDHDEKNHDQGG